MSHKKEISIDSNVFRNFDFINFITLEKSNLIVHLTSIVQLEVSYFYLAKGANWEEFLKDINKFNGQLSSWDSVLIPRIIRSAFKERKNLPFKSHFRDFIIGIESIDLNSDIITYNKRHFKWVKEVEIMTPEEFIKNYKSM